MSIDRVRHSAARATELHDAWAAASAALTTAMRQARAEGATLQAIADAAGISRQVVHRRLK